MGTSTGSTQALVGKVCFITGGGSGIGLETARKFSSEGAAVFIVDYLADRVDSAIETLASHKSGVRGVAADVTSEVAVQTAFDACIAAFGGVDIVVSNAGVFISGSKSWLCSDGDWDRSMAINFHAHRYVSSIAVKVMHAQSHGGSLLFNISKAPLNPGPLQGTSSSRFW